METFVTVEIDMVDVDSATAVVAKLQGVTFDVILMEFRLNGPGGGAALAVLNGPRSAVQKVLNSWGYDQEPLEVYLVNTD